MVDPLENLQRAASNLTGLERVGAAVSADELLLRIATGPDEYGLEDSAMPEATPKLGPVALATAHDRAGQLLRSRIEARRNFLRLVAEPPQEEAPAVA